MNKKYETYKIQMKVAKRSGNKVQHEKLKDRAKYIAAKEASKKNGKGKGKVDEDEPLPEVLKKWKDYSVEFHFPEPTELTPPLLQLIEINFSYPNREDFRLSNVDVGITRRSVDQLKMEETPVQYLLFLHPDQEGLSKQEAAYAKLGKFGLPSYNHLIPVAKLSGGEKARVVFSSISMSKPHKLLLDEPKNHLDMQSIDSLANAINEVIGGVVLVSHDSRLISQEKSCMHWAHEIPSPSQEFVRMKRRVKFGLWKMLRRSEAELLVLRPELLRAPTVGEETTGAPQSVMVRIVEMDLLGHLVEDLVEERVGVDEHEASVVLLRWPHEEEVAAFHL
ncbi:hypothetical protein SO802_009302 [Lithocarpus litseifolius]|uniref:ABC transporter domain-containing protein n=1 Tax=Lithocarpus litseifolius TaxID=425828 RepID=A0AAW2DB03_9ROSI